MQVLILDCDLFDGGGGGQTFYRKVIADNPGVSFKYFRSSESLNQPRPGNASTVALAPETALSIQDPLFFSERHRLALRRALSFAASVEGESFDVIDLPDYNVVGPYVRDALDFHKVAYGRVVLSMHGVISESVRLDWETEDGDALDLRQLEERQYSGADYRYAISTRYAKDWIDRCGGDIELLNPLNVLERSMVSAPVACTKLPEILCVGRRERRKGNDIAIEIAAWIDPALHRGLRHIGSPGTMPDGRSSDDILARMANAHGVVWRSEAAMPQARLFEEYRRNTIALFPVRYDTFNLAALEAAALGVPIAVSVHAGICDYLDALAPGAPYLKIDPDRPDEAAAHIEEWLLNFHDVRLRAFDFATRLQSEIGSLNLTQTYARALSGQPNRAPRHSLRFASSLPARDRTARNMIRQMINSVRPPVRRVALSIVPRGAPRASRAALRAFRREQSFASLKSLAISMNRTPERSVAEIAEKVALARGFDLREPGRALLWAELSRLERLRGNDLRAACYAIRTIRLSHGDRFGLLAPTMETLGAQGLSEVASILNAEYGRSGSPGALKTLLSEREARLKQPAPLVGDGFEKVFDGRPDSSRPKVSVLVSVYNAGTKLATFARLLSHQTLIQKGALEVIIVDAASPADEWANLHREGDMAIQNALFVRTRTRVTIQAAWNIALQFARGDYVTCLGVDETLYPAALEVLADRLETDRSADWAMGTSVVTEVSEAGAFVRDKSVFDRSDAHRHMTYLDTTYVSWVGALYRRNIHERFGYYDPAFQAAGDTEFKMRVLPHINVSFVDRTLGIFRDYPDARASASVRAEVEDQLAWYAHRGVTGASQLLDRASDEDLERILGWCAGRRKCYGVSPSTDVEFGFAASAILASRPGAPPWALDLVKFYARLRDELRAYDLAEGAFLARASRADMVRRWKGYAVEYAGLRGGSAFSAFNDNRFEQHSWIWSDDS